VRRMQHVPFSMAMARMVSLVSVSSPGQGVVKNESFSNSAADGRSYKGFPGGHGNTDCR
jgi:hypothetical protein